MIPEQCHLWHKDPLTFEDYAHAHFERLQEYEDDTHLMRRLLKCQDCGQLYFYEFYEWIDWQNGNDPQYVTLVPVASAEEASKLAELSPIQVAGLRPALHKD